VLRDECKLTGTKEGCSIGVCGSCSVLIDGRLMSACLVLAASIDGSSIRTVEGLADGAQPSKLQESFVRAGGFQCGICTPGQVVAASALLERNPNPSEDDVRRWMMGNLCRCTGYYQIVEAILEAVKAD
jgi:aerobic carbon-monoxide dehydrogenase small subunit